MEEIKAVIFDWGRTLYDSENKKEFSESVEVLSYLGNKGYLIATVSLVTPVANATLAERTESIEKSPLRRFFRFATAVGKNKDAAFDEAVKVIGFSREQVLIVGDRVIRDVKYANQNGHPSVWVQRGKFADELPNKETGEPTHTIKLLKELVGLL